MDKIIELIQETKNLVLKIHEESQNTSKKLTELLFQFREEAKEDIKRHDKILARLESNETILAKIVERMEQRTSDHEKRIEDIENRM